MKLKGLGNLIGLGIALMWLAVPTKTFGVQACIAARFNDYRDFGCRLPPGPWHDLSIPAYQAHCVPCNGMPQWWVSEPYINAWVADEPLSYPMSSGQQMTFRWYHRQRYQLPTPVEVPDFYRSGNSFTPHTQGDYYLALARSCAMTNAAWSHHWMKDIVFWDSQWEDQLANSPYVAGGPVFSQGYEALVFGSQGDIGYFYSVSNNSRILLQDPRRRQQLQPLSALGYPTVNTPVKDTNNIFWGGSQTNGFQMVYPDGSKEVFGLCYYPAGLINNVQSHYAYSGAHAFLTQRIDPQGRVARLGYECFINTNYFGDATSFGFRLRYVVDPDGRTNTFTYATDYSAFFNYSPPNPWALKEVQDPYGRKAQFSHDFVSGILTSITDAAGLTSSFDYQAPIITNTYYVYGSCGGGVCPTNIAGMGSSRGWVTNLTTPYGTTSFSYFQEQEPGDTNGYIRRAVLVTEPNNAHQLFYYRHTNSDVMVSYKSDVPTVPGYALDTGASGGDHHEFFYRNTFHWDRRQFAALSVTDWSNLSNALSNVTSNDFRKAQLQHWLLGSDAESVTESLSSEREPSPDAAGLLEGAWTWYDYPFKSYGHPEQESTEPLVGCTARLLPDGTSQYSAVDLYLANGSPYRQWETYTKPDGTIGTRTNYFQFDVYNGVDLRSFSNSLGQSVKLTYTNHSPIFVTNTLGQVATLNWDSTTWNYAGATFVGGQTASATYYASNSTSANGGFLKTITWSPGPSWGIGYDKGLPKIATNDLGLIVSFTWDDLLRATSVSFPDSSYTSNRYDKLDLAATRDRLGNWTYFGYDALRHLTAVTNANQAVTRLDWCDCGALAGVTDALTNTTSLYYDNQGQLTNVLFADTSSLKYFYDSVGWLTNLMDGASRSLKLGYNNQGLLTTVSNAYGRMWQVVLDALNRPQQITDANNVTVTNAYDLLNRLTNRVWADGFGETFGWSTNGLIAYTNRDGKVTRFTRDAAGRLLAVTNANQEITRFFYNSLSEVTNLYDALNHQTLWTYDEYGRRRSKTDALSRVTSWDYNANGWLTNRALPQSGNTAYAYDAVGNLTNISYTGGTSSTSPISFVYDVLSRLTNIVDALGTTTFKWTAAGQLASEDGPWSDDTVTNTYTEGLRTAMSVGTWSQTYGFDAAWRMTNITSPVGAFGYAYGNQPSTLIHQLLLPNSAFITNHYDSLSRLEYTALAQSSGRVLDGYGYTHDPLGLRTNLSRSFGLINSTVSLGYDVIGQLTSWTAKETSGTSRLNEHLGWNYDFAGNLHYRTNNALLQTFTVDNANELTGIARSGTFTAAGNTTTPATNVTVNGTTASRYADNTWAATNFTLANGNNSFTNTAQNPYGFTVTNTLTVNLPASVSLAFDLNGNLTNDGTRGFSYDAENQLTTNWVTGAWKTEFVYDGFGRRRITRDYGWSGSAWVKTNETRLVYDGLLPIEERDANNVLLVAYTRGLDLSGSLRGAGGIGGLLARTDTKGTAFYHADGAGNITALMNGNQLIVGKYLYDPFGNLLAMSGPLAPANRVRFSSKPHLPHAEDIYDFGWRDWFARPQRWGSPDPLGEWSDVNLYRGMRNNPLSYVDPFGETWYKPWTWGEPSDLSESPTGDLSLPPLPIPDPNTFGGMHGINNDFGGQTGAQVAMDVGKAVPKGFVTAAMMVPFGEEKAAAEAGKGLWPWLKSLPSKCRSLWKKPSGLPKIFGSRGGTTAAEKVGELENAMLKGEYRFNAPEGKIGGWINSKGEYMIGEGHHRMQAAIEAAKQSGDPRYIQQLLENGVWTRVDQFPTPPTSLPPVR